MLTEINPKLPMRDKNSTKEYYIDKLEFSEISDYGDYLLIRKDNVEIHFFEFKDLELDTCISGDGIVLSYPDNIICKLIL